MRPAGRRLSGTGHSNRIKRMLVVLAYMWLWPLPTTCPSIFSPVFLAADDATRNFLFFIFLKHAPDTNHHHHHVVVSQ